MMRDAHAAVRQRMAAPRPAPRRLVIRRALVVRPWIRDIRRYTRLRRAAGLRAAWPCSSCPAWRPPSPPLAASRPVTVDLTCVPHAVGRETGRVAPCRMPSPTLAMAALVITITSCRATPCVNMAARPCRGIRRGGAGRREAVLRLPLGRSAAVAYSALDCDTCPSCRPQARSGLVEGSTAPSATRSCAAIGSRIIRPTSPSWEVPENSVEDSGVRTCCS